MIEAVLGGLLVTAILFVMAKRGAAGVQEGARVSYGMLRSVAAQILIGMALAAMTQVVLPTEIISRWMGAGSGILGIVIGMAAGAIVPGGPYVVLPLAGSVMASGAGVGAMAAFITAWSVTPLTRTLMWELPFLGGRFTAARLLVTLPFPVIAGLLTPPIFDLLR